MQSDQERILQASYLIYKEEYNPERDIVYLLNEVTFYTFNGDPILTIKDSSPNKERRLDPRAPLPQPISYDIKSLDMFAFVYFKDKHNNTIKRYLYRKDNDQIVVKFKTGTKIYQFNDLLTAYDRAKDDFPLDLSIIKKIY